MKPKVNRMKYSCDKLTGLRYSKTSRRTLKIREDRIVQEDLYWREFDEELNK